MHQKTVTLACTPLYNSPKQLGRTQITNNNPIKFHTITISYVPINNAYIHTRRLYDHRHFSAPQRAVKIAMRCLTIWPPSRGTLYTLPYHLLRAGWVSAWARVKHRADQHPLMGDNLYALCSIHVCARTRCTSHKLLRAHSTCVCLPWRPCQRRDVY